MPQLIAASALSRTFYFFELPGTPIVEYFGGGYGWEGVFENGELIALSTSYLWFTPRYEFPLAGSTIEIDVKVWPWLRIRTFRLLLNSRVVYQEANKIRPPETVAIGIVPPPLIRSGRTAQTIAPLVWQILGMLLLLLVFFLVESWLGASES